MIRAYQGIEIKNTSGEQPFKILEYMVTRLNHGDGFRPLPVRQVECLKCSSAIGTKIDQAESGWTVSVWKFTLSFEYQPNTKRWFDAPLQEVRQWPESGSRAGVEPGT